MTSTYYGPVMLVTYGLGGESTHTFLAMLMFCCCLVRLEEPVNRWFKAARRDMPRSINDFVVL